MLPMILLVALSEGSVAFTDCPLFREPSVLLVNNSCAIFAVSGDYCQVIPVGNTCMIVGDH